MQTLHVSWHHLQAPSARKLVGRLLKWEFRKIRLKGVLFTTQTNCHLCIQPDTYILNFISPPLVIRSHSAWCYPLLGLLPSHVLPGHRDAWLVGFTKKADTQGVTVQRGRRKNDLGGRQQGKEGLVRNDRAAEPIPRNPRPTDRAAQTTGVCVVSCRGSPSSWPPGRGAARWQPPSAVQMGKGWQVVMSFFSSPRGYSNKVGKQGNLLF